MNPIEISFTPGATLYAIIHHPDGRVWNTNSLAFEAYNAAHWTQYAISLTEQTNSGYYSAPYPSQITGVLTSESVYNQVGGTPAIPADAPAIGLGQSQGSDIRAIEGDATTVDKMKAAIDTELLGAAISGTLSTTQMTTNLLSSVNDAFVGRVILFRSGALVNQAALITAYDGTAKMLTFSQVTSAPSPGDTFIIV